MTWLLLTGGMLLKVLEISGRQYQKRDPWKVLFALFVGFLLAARLAAEHEPGDWPEPGAGLPLGFALMTAFAFRDRLLPRVTEGALFALGLIGVYLFYKGLVSSSAGPSLIDAVLFSFMALYVASSVALVVTSRIIGKVAQTVVMVLFVAMSVYIGTILVLHTAAYTSGSWEVIVIGYSSLVLVANVFYLLYFIPIPGKHQTLSDRMRNIRAHAAEFEKKFVAVNSPRWQIAGTTLLFLSLVVIDSLIMINDALLVSIVLSFAMLINRAPTKDIFTPAKVAEKW